VPEGRSVGLAAKREQAFLRAGRAGRREQKSRGGESSEDQPSGK